MNDNRIFVDTGAWLALSLTDDRYHNLANQTLKQLLKSGTRLITSNHVIGETYTFLTRIHSSRVAWNFIEKIRASKSLDYYFTDEKTESSAYDLLHKFSDQRFSFVDAVSFAIMNELEINKAFAFDKHFTIVGFTRIPVDSG